MFILRGVGFQVRSLRFQHYLFHYFSFEVDPGDLHLDAQRLVPPKHLRDDI